MMNAKVLDNYLKYGRVLVLDNGEIEAYVTIDLGPRIIRFGKLGGQNFMRDNRDAFAPMNDKTFTDFFGADKKWENFGGHRIWASPEAYPQTYYPDDAPVDYSLTENGAVFTPETEMQVGLQKQLELAFTETEMQVTMRIENMAKQPQTFAIWGLTVSAQGGDLIIPMNQNNTGLLSNRIISVWPYTDLGDKRVHFGDKYVVLHQDKNAERAFKLGFDLNGGKVHYLLNGEVFTKSWKTEHPEKVYPDGGCSFETYTCNEFIEIESLSPLSVVEPNGIISLTEHWSVQNQPCAVDLTDENSVDSFVKKL